LERALETLAAGLELQEVPGPTTHTAVVARGLDSPDVTAALGTYLVGLLAGAIDIDAQLSDELLGVHPDSRREVRDHATRLIGRDNHFRTPDARRFRDRVRNPWIAEGLGHAILVLRTRVQSVCCVEEIHALKQPHPEPSRQGLDLLAIYDTASAPGLLLGEAKASRRYGVRRLKEAVEFYTGFEAGRRGGDIRAEVHALKHVLPDAVRAGIYDGFWRDESCYVPLIVHSQPIREGEDHDGLDGLRPPIASKRLLAVRLRGFHAFFNSVADGMRDSLDRLGY
jgi:hypothetical protein